MKHPRRAFLSALSLLAASLTELFAPGLRAQSNAKPYVVLVSIDGYRSDYTDRYKAKHLAALRDVGASAAMIPSFPSITFPNHIAIVTGEYPEHHGIVGNTFFDVDRNQEYSMRSMGADGSWYEDATPLWVLAEQQHVTAACMFWPTCDGEVRGVRPTYWKKYDGKFPDESRVKQVLDWLRLPEEQRPHFITLYFSDVDSAGHAHGPESLEVGSAVQLVDSLIGSLRAGLAALKLPIDLVLVSDHGMQAATGGFVNLSGIVEPGKVRVEVDGPVALIYCGDPEAIKKTYATLKKDTRLEVYKRQDAPARWHYNENPRSGDLVAIVKGPAVFTTAIPGAQGREAKPPIGEHGYDPREFATMQAIFYATGPNIKPATKIPSFENVNVYPFIAKILGLKLPGKLDGSEAVLDPIYLP
jgi:predicted AlkP superfamily pyrophosphatase or phosphodiesterase